MTKRTRKTLIVVLGVIGAVILFFVLLYFVVPNLSKIFSEDNRVSIINDTDQEIVVEPVFRKSRYQGIVQECLRDCNEIIKRIKPGETVEWVTYDMYFNHFELTDFEDSKAYCLPNQIHGFASSGNYSWSQLFEPAPLEEGVSEMYLCERDLQ